MNRALFLLLFLLSMVQAKAQTRSLYSSYLFNEILINPALAGTAGALSLSVNYRNQAATQKVAGTPETFSAAAHSPTALKNVALSFLAVADRFGVTNNTEANAGLAYKIPIRSVTLSVGAQMGYAFFRNDYSQLTLTDQNDATFSQNQNFNVLKYGAGAYVHHKRFFAGYSLPAIYSPNAFIQTQSPQHFAHIGSNYKLHSLITLRPSVLAKYMDGIGWQYDLNLLASISKYAAAGVSYRVNETLVALASIKPTQQLQIGYAYDYPLNAFRNFGPIHEFFIRYDFKYTIKDLNVKTFN